MQRRELQVPQSTGAEGEPIWFQSWGSFIHSFAYSLTHLLLSPPSASQWLQPSLAQATPGHHFGLFPLTTPPSPSNHLQVLLVLPSKYNSNFTFSPPPLPPASSKPGDASASPLGSLCPRCPPVIPCGSHTSKSAKAKSKSDSLPPLLRTLRDSRLTQSKSQSLS